MLTRTCRTDQDEERSKVDVNALLNEFVRNKDGEGTRHRLKIEALESKLAESEGARRHLQGQLQLLKSVCATDPPPPADYLMSLVQSIQLPVRSRGEDNSRVQFFYIKLIVFSFFSEPGCLTRTGELFKQQPELCQQ